MPNTTFTRLLMRRRSYLIVISQNKYALVFSIDAHSFCSQVENAWCTTDACKL